MMRAVTAAKQRPGFPSKRSLIEIALEVGYATRERSEAALPIRQLHKVEDYVCERLASFHFSFQFSAFQFLLGPTSPR